MTEAIEDGKIEVMKVPFRLRPSREGGARIGSEIVGEEVVMHTYGYTGAG